MDQSLLTSAATGLIDGLCAELFFAARAREQDDNLLFVRERLLRAGVDLAAVLSLYDQIVARKRVPDDETNPFVSVLRLAGITRTVGDQLRLRNRIYAHVFDRGWLEANMPDAEVRRQKAAFRRGALRTGGLSLLVLSVISILAILALNQSRHARAVAHELRQNLYIADMKIALQDWEEGRFGQAVEVVEKYFPTSRAEDLRGFEWRYLWQATRDNSLYTSHAHHDRVQAVSLSADGTILATASKDHTIKVWAYPSLREIRTIDTGHWLQNLVISSDGRWLASTRMNNEGMELWDLRSGARMGSFMEEGQKALGCFSSDSKTLITGNTKGQVEFRDVATGRLKAKLETGDSRLVYPYLSNDGNQAAVTAQDDGRVSLWDIAASREKGSIPEPHAGRIVVDPDFRRLAMVNPQNILKIWDMKNQRVIAALPISQQYLVALAFSPDGKVLAYSTSDQRVRLWDYEHGEQRGLLQGHEGPIFSLAFGADGKSLITGSLDGTFKIWRTSGNELNRPLQGNYADFNGSCLAFSPDGRFLSCPGANHTVKVWDVGAQHESAILEGHRNYVLGLAFSPDGNLLASSGAESSVRVWDWRAKREVFNVMAQSTWNRAVAFSRDGKMLAIGNGKDVGPDRNRTIGVCELWDMATRRLVGTLEGHQGTVNGIAFSPDNKLIATSSDDNTVKLWDLAGKHAVSTLKDHTDCSDAVAFSPDGTQVASAADDGTVLIWMVRTGKMVKRLRVSSEFVMGVAFSPDGQTLATGSWDRMVRLWNVATWQNTLTLKGHSGAVISVAFSPDGKTLASLSTDTTVRLWKAPSLAEIDAMEKEFRKAK